jgi:hypothetical protein
MSYLQHCLEGGGVGLLSQQFLHVNKGLGLRLILALGLVLTLLGLWLGLNLQSRTKIIETTNSLPPPHHKHCWTNETKVYCQVKFFSSMNRGEGEK